MTVLRTRQTEIIHYSALTKVRSPAFLPNNLFTFRTRSRNPDAKCELCFGPGRQPGQVSAPGPPDGRASDTSLVLSSKPFQIYFCRWANVRFRHSLHESKCASILVFVL